MSDCTHSPDVGAYLLGALDEPAAADFEAHLGTCEACKAEVRDLRVVADNLPLAVPSVAPPPALKGRLMSVVESEAQLLRATGAAADRPVTRTAKRRRWPRTGLRPALATAVAAAVIGVFVLAPRGGSGSRTVSASVAPAGAHASLRVTGHHAELSVAHMPSPAGGRVYEVWLVRTGRAPQPTHALFGVAKDGRAVVKIPESVRGADAVWVTAEPSTGSDVPTSAPVIKASLT
jgi:anti-sigma factor RsiW